MKEELEQLKQRLHNYIDAEISKVVKAMPPEDKFKKGDYVYWSGNSPGVGIVEGKCKTFDYAYNINFINKQGVETSCYNGNLRLATESEIFEALKTECLKLFKVGDEIESRRNLNCILGNEKHTGIIDKKQLFFFADGEVWAYAEPCNVCVFTNGKFATVIESKQSIQHHESGTIYFTQPITPELLTKIKNLL